MITKEMIEAAARAAFGASCAEAEIHREWEDDGEDTKRVYRRIAEAALTAALSSQWRGMESAPRDGTYVRNLAANGERIQPLAWAWSPNAQMHAWCGVLDGVVLPHEPQPTHWLPESSLPPPPTQE